jgi:hypothetical protein
MKMRIFNRKKELIIKTKVVVVDRFSFIFDPI